MELLKSQMPSQMADGGQDENCGNIAFNMGCKDKSKDLLDCQYSGYPFWGKDGNPEQILCIKSILTKFNAQLSSKGLNSNINLNQFISIPDISDKILVCLKFLIELSSANNIDQIEQLALMAEIRSCLSKQEQEQPRL